jgi:hypothetical protein
MITADAWYRKIVVIVAASYSETIPSRNYNSYRLESDCQPIGS